MESTPQYVPGTCNIGGAEAAARRRIGVGGLLVTLALAAALFALDAHPALFAVLALPAFVAATGFIQARTRFCPGYGMHGMSNFRDDVRGAEHTTTVPEELAADRARSKRITLHAALLGLAVASLAAAVAAVAS